MCDAQAITDKFLNLSSLTGDFFFVPPLSKPPLSVGVDLADLQTQAEAEQQALSSQQEAKSQWNNWQNRMKEDFLNISKFETKDLVIGLKVESWRRFVKNQREDNPFSQEDTNLRSRAEAPLRYWRREQLNVSELKQVELDLEKQENQAKQRFNPINKDFPVITRFLSGNQSAEAGELLSKYGQREKRNELQVFFAKQPASI